jgi:16S rRNA processing protein RimM
LFGKINGLFGVRGWVKIFSYTEPRENILSYQPWYVQIDGKWSTVEIISGRVQGKTIVAQIKDVDNTDKAEQIIGVDIYVEKSQLPELKDGAHYWDDLIGLEVINTASIHLGVVENLVDTGSNHVLIVNGNTEHWVPYIEPYLISVDIDKKRIIVDWDENF